MFSGMFSDGVVGARCVVAQLHLERLSSLPSVQLAVLAAFHEQLVLRHVSLKAVHVDAAGAAAAAAQEGPDGSALTGVAHGITEHLVDLLLRGHPPVRV